MGSPGCTPHSPVFISHTHYMDSGTDCLDEDVKPPRSLLGLPELSWPAVCLPYCDRITTEEDPWMLRMTEGPTPAMLPSRTLEPCSIKPNQFQDSSSGTEGQMEECYLEQVQTMVMGEVLKDVDTACKLLSIASGTAYCQTVTLEYDCRHVHPLIQCLFSCNSPLMAHLLVFSRGQLGGNLVVAYTSKFSFPCFLSSPVWLNRRHYRGPAHLMQTFLLTVLKTLFLFRVFVFVSAQQWKLSS